MKIFKFLAGAVIVAAGLTTAFFGAGKISEEKEFASQKHYRGVISVWQIDSFEGGSGSRKNFLLSAARGFEKENEGVLVMVTEHTPESAEKSMREGSFPDAVSYGNGTEITGAKKLSTPFFIGGAVGKDMYAVPWCRGGYCLIANVSVGARFNGEFPDLSSETVIVSQGEYTVPLAALCTEKENPLKIGGLDVLKPMEAYVKFAEGKTKYFLGTQRDVVRLTTRGFSLEVYPLAGYNDIYQYISLTSVSDEKSFYAEKFINYLLSEKVQESLHKINMFSAFYNVKNDNATLNLIQNADCKRTVSAFTSKEELRNLQNSARGAAAGKEAEYINLKNMLS